MATCPPGFRYQGTMRQVEPVLPVSQTHRPARAEQLMRDLRNTKGQRGYPGRIGDTGPVVRVRDRQMSPYAPADEAGSALADMPLPAAAALSGLTPVQYAGIGLLALGGIVIAVGLFRGRSGLGGLNGNRKKIVPTGRVVEHLNPAKLDRTSTRMVGWDTEVKVWKSRSAMARAIRKQEMNPASKDDWRAYVPLTPGEGF